MWRGYRLVSPVQDVLELMPKFFIINVDTVLLSSSYANVRSVFPSQAMKAIAIIPYIHHNLRYGYSVAERLLRCAAG